MAFAESFGKKLRALRDERGLRQEDIGKVANVGKSAVSQWESGIRIPDLETVNKLSEYFNISTDYLLGRTDSRTAKQYDKIDIWSQDTPPTDVEFEEFLKSSNVYFSGAPLTDEDKEDIIAYLRFKWEREREKREKEKGS